MRSPPGLTSAPMVAGTCRLDKRKLRLADFSDTVRPRAGWEISSGVRLMLEGPAEGVVAMGRPFRGPPDLKPSSRPRRGRVLPSPQMGMEAVLEATVSVPWERPVHAARLAFLRRVARAGEVSVHMACGTDRLGFIDAAFGLTTILTDVDSAALNILALQYADFAARCGPLPGTLQCRQLPVEEVTSDDGFSPRSIQHLTLLNLFNANLHAASQYARLIDPLLTVIAPGGSLFFTTSEADVLWRRARARQLELSRLGEIQGYYDENIVLLQVGRSSP
jgi:hypothetical protein